MENTFISTLTSLGFKELDHYEDFGSTLKNVYYCKRVSESKGHEYLSLTFHRDQFLEAAYERYQTKKNTRGKVGNRPLKDRQKDGTTTVELGIFRSLDEMIVSLS